MKGILRRFLNRNKPGFPARDRTELFRQRAARVCNRDAAAAARMVRVHVILAEGRKC